MEIYKKLLEVKKQIGVIKKSSKNPFFDSKYFDINALINQVEPILNSHGLVLLQPIRNGEQGSIIIDAETGGSVESFLMLPKLDNPQKVGSAVSYYRRYTLCSLLALEAIDDDGNVAAKPTDYEKDLKGCKTEQELGAYYKSMPADKKKAFAKLTTELKLELSK